MPQFKWYGLSSDGAPLSSTVFARSRDHVHEMSLPAAMVIRVVPLKRLFQGVRMRRLLFFSHLADLLEGGALVREGLAVIAQSSSDPLIRAWAEDLILHVVAGVSLAHAVAKWPEFADQQLIAAITLGEKTGTMALSIKGFVWLTQMHDELIQSARRSMALPLVAGACTLLVAVLFVVTIRPQYQALIESLPAGKGVQLCVIMGSFSAYWIGFALCIVSLLGFGLFRKRRLLRAYIPALAAYDEALFLVRLSTLISQRYGLAESLVRASETSASWKIREWGMRAGNAVQAGGSFSVLCCDAPLSPEACSLLLLGERSGDLERWASKAALRGRDAALIAAKKTASIVVAFLLIGVGLLIAGVIYALYQPIILLMQAV